MKYHFWYKKLGVPSEMEFEGPGLHAFNQAHEILRGYYNYAEESSEGYRFYSSKKECVGVLSLLQEASQEEKTRRGLATLGEMLACQLRDAKRRKKT